MSKNKKTTVALLGVLLVAVVITVGVTYALWQITLQQETTNVITTGCFKVTMEEGEAINLTNAYPMSDEEGKNLVPYTFTIKNNCTEKASYVLNLETVSEGEKILKDEYVKASLKNNENELFLNTLNDTNENLEKVIESASKAYKLTEGTLSGEEEKTFELRLWMDENTEAIDEVMNASFMGKITLTSSYVPINPMSGVMIPLEVSFGCPGGEGCGMVNMTYVYPDDEGYSLSKVVYQSAMNLYQDAVKVVDFSVLQDKSVFGYYVKDTDSTTHTLYIQANGKNKLNPKASYYGSVEGYDGQTLILVEGIENWDTSLVEDMSEMFWCYAGNSLDLSHFDTSEVKNMSSMFSGRDGVCDNHIAALNLSNFDTSNVTNMSSMFEGMSSLTSLDLSNFDTRNVTRMGYMFRDCAKLTTTINITNPNVESYDFMFNGAATEEGAQITVNYTTETSDLVDRMIATKSKNSNVVKGSLIS